MILIIKLIKIAGTLQALSSLHSFTSNLARSPIRFIVGHYSKC